MRAARCFAAPPCARLRFSACPLLPREKAGVAKSTYHRSQGSTEYIEHLGEMEAIKEEIGGLKLQPEESGLSSPRWRQLFFASKHS